MKEDDILKEAIEIKKELQESEIEIKKSKKPIQVILMFIIALLVIMMIIPHYSIKLDPSPKKVPSIEEIIVPIDNKPHNFTLNNKESFRLLFNPVEVKQSADSIASYSCKDNQICQAKAIFYFVRDNFNYISDPTYIEYVKTAPESLHTKGGDCDDASVLLINLLGAIGIKSRLVFIPNHVYVQIYLPEALKKYKEDNWVNLDATCKYCEFGEIPRENIQKYKTIIEI